MPNPLRLLLTLLVATPAMAQTTPADPHLAVAALEAAVPAPRPEDVATPQSLLAAIYSTISGPAGPRDWTRFRSLMLPEARFTRAVTGSDGVTHLRSRSVSDFIEAATPIIAKEGFFESGLVNKIDRFGNLAQIFTSYESRHAPGEKPFARGINSMQFVSDGHRWWVVSIAWDEERPGNPLPPAMQ